MKARSNAKTKEKTKLQKLFPIQKNLLNLYDALLQASSFSNDDFYNDFNINDKRNCDKLIQKACTVFSEFDIIEVGTVGNPLVFCFNPPLNKMEYWGRNKKLMEDSFKCSIHDDSDSEEDDNPNNDYNRKTCVCNTKIKIFYALENRVTSKHVCPIGCVCIWKIADPDTAQILTESNKIIEKYNVTKEKRRVLREKKRIREE